MHDRRTVSMMPIAALGLVSACTSMPATGRISASDLEVRVIDTFLFFYAKRDVEGVLSLMAENVYFEDPTMHLLARDRKELRQIVQQGADAFSNIAIKPFNRIEASPWTIVQQRITGTILRKNGESRIVDVQGLSLFEIHGGKIHRWYDYFDVLRFRQQAG